MHNRFYILALLFNFITANLFGQCPTSEVGIKNQNELNQFLNNYPNCTKILASISIIDSGDIIDLSGLQKIDTILGGLTLSLKSDISLDGLNNLKYVGGDLDVINMTKLKELNSFKSLKTIKNELSINYNFMLEKISGFQNLDNVGSIGITENGPLFSIDAFHSVDTVFGIIGFGYLTPLKYLSGFENLKYAGHLHISHSNSLIEIPTFNALEYIKNDLTIGGTKLQTYTGFNELKKVGQRMIVYLSEVTSLNIAPKVISIGQLEVNSCPKLKVLQGFDSLKFTRNLTINLDVLPDLNLFHKIDTVSEKISILCPELLSINTLTQLKFAGSIDIVTIKTLSSNIGSSLNKVNGQFRLISFNAKTSNDFTKLQEVKGDLTISLGEVFVFPKFDSLKSVGGLEISSFNSLKKITGFNKLIFIKGKLTISFNSNIDSLDAFENLQVCRDGFSLRSNNNLTFLSEFPNLDTLGELSLFDNQKLKFVSGFNKLRYLHRSTNYFGIYVYNSFALQHITGFDKLEICGTIDIANTIAIKKLAGFSSLREIWGELIISGRIPELPNFNKLRLIKGKLNISNNAILLKLPEMVDLEIIEKDLFLLNCLEVPALPKWPKLRIVKGSITIGNLVKILDIDGLRKVNPSLVTDLSIYGNTKLTSCNNAFICAYLDLGKPFSLNNNALGCKAKDEILCEGGFLYGKVYYDRNSNKIFDITEFGMPNQKIEINDGDLTLYSNDIGQYGFYGDFNKSYKVNLYLSSNLTLTTDSLQFNILFESSLKDKEVISFGLVQNQEIHDGSINITSQGSRCNETNKILIHVSNRGSFDENAEVRFYFNDFNSVSNFIPMPDNVDITKGYCSWNFNNFVPPSSKNFTLFVKYPQEEFTGDTLNFSASYYRRAIDNSFILQDSTQLEDIVRCAFDPNDKAVNPLGKGSKNEIQSNTKLYYTIRFQNIGNDTAKNVRIEDLFSEALNVKSFEFISSSHNCNMVLDGNQLIFYFNGINLPDSLKNPSQSQGFVSFNLTLKPDLAIGTKIENLAKIYFDQNSPIFTNTVFNTIEEIVSVNEFNKFSDNITIFPNPVQDHFCIQANDEYEVKLVEVFDVLSRRVYRGYGTCHEIGNLPSGFYRVVIVNNIDKRKVAYLIR